MRSLRIFVLEEFKNNARAAGVAPETIKVIAENIARTPFNAYHQTPLYNEIGRYPMSGFYVLPLWYDAMGERKSGNVLYLYISADFPVYIWDFHAGSYDEHPWSSDLARHELVGYGQEIHRTLLGVF